MPSEFTTGQTCEGSCGGGVTEARKGQDRDEVFSVWKKAILLKDQADVISRQGIKGPIAEHKTPPKERMVHQLARQQSTLEINGPKAERVRLVGPLGRPWKHTRN